MTANRSTRSAAGRGAAVVIIVTILFGTLAFVAGVSVGRGGLGGIGAGQSSLPVVTNEAVPSVPATPEPTPAPTPVLETVTCSEPTEAFAVLCETYAQIKGEYVDEVSDEDLVNGAVRGMVEYGLGDPYSGYLPPEQFESAQDDLSGEFSGIGAEVGIENLADPEDLASCTVVTETCALIIIAPLDGSPAENAGLRSGDQVQAIDGTSTLGGSVSALVYEVRGEPGTEVTLSVVRGDTEIDITVTRALIDLKEVSAEVLEPGIGYIRLTSFTSRATGLFRDALGGILDEGINGLVVDLRGNPGGYITAAQGIASEFVPAGELLFTVESGEDVRRWESQSGGLAQSDAIEVVLLVDVGSASASEIVAGALQDTGRATILGEATFGKNTVQIWNDLPNGGGLRITTDRWFTPRHNSAAPNGIQPDVVVSATDDPVADEDPQLDRALEVLRED